MKRIVLICTVILIVLAMPTFAFACNENCDRHGTGECFFDETVLTWCEQFSGSCILHPDLCDGPSRPETPLTSTWTIASVEIERPQLPAAVTSRPAPLVAQATPAPPIQHQ